MNGFHPPAAMQPGRPAASLNSSADMSCCALPCCAVPCRAGYAAPKRRSGPPPVKASPLTPSSATRGSSEREDDARKIEQGKQRYKEANRQPAADEGDLPAVPDDGWERLEDYKDLSMDGEDGGTHTAVQWDQRGLSCAVCRCMQDVFEGVAAFVLKQGHASSTWVGLARMPMHCCSRTVWLFDIQT